MAKIVLYASAASGKTEGLIAAARALTDCKLVTDQKLQLALMTPLACG
jgi:hypothetical protein